MKTDFIDRYTIQQKHPNSDKTILKDKTTQELILMRQVLVYTHTDFKETVQALEVQKQLKHPSLLSLIDYEFILQGTTEIGPQRKALCYFEYSKYPLDVEIGCRQAQQQYFQESQLWGILFSLTRVLSYLQSKTIGHGGISSSGIFICQKSGDIKLCDPAMTQASSFNLSNCSFYSPQYLQIHASNRDINQLNIFKSDVFCLGMCILQASLLQNCCDCYHYEKGILNKHLLKSKKIQLRQYYSYEYCNMIDLLLSINYKERPDFIELEQLLRKAGMSSNFSSLNVSINEINEEIEREIYNNIKQTHDIEGQQTIMLQPLQPEILQQEGQQPILSIVIDLQSSNDIQHNLQIDRNEFQTHILLRQSSRSLVKTRSYQSLASVRSVESKQMHPTATGQSYQKVERTQYSIKEFSDWNMNRQNKQNNPNISNFGSKIDQGWSNYVYNPSPHQIYTDPALVQLIRQQLDKVAKKRHI